MPASTTRSALASQHPTPTPTPIPDPDSTSAPRSRFAAASSFALAVVAAAATVACSSFRGGDGAGDFADDGTATATASHEATLGSRERGSRASDTAVIRLAFNDVERPIVIQLDPSAAPKTVANFKEKILSGYYEGTALHRVIPRYVIQGGDPLSRDDGNRGEWGTGGGDETIPAEIGLDHTRGAVAMARKTTGNPAKASSASQFYITLAAQPELDSGYTVFGYVAQGMDVLDSISRSVVDSNDNPLRRIEITSTALIPPGATVDDPGQSQGVGGRTNSIPASRKSGFTRFVERIW